MIARPLVGAAGRPLLSAPRWPLRARALARPRYPEPRHDDPGAAPTVGVPTRAPARGRAAARSAAAAVRPGGPPPGHARRAGRARGSSRCSRWSRCSWWAPRRARSGSCPRGSAPAPSPEPPPAAGAAPPARSARRSSPRPRPRSGGASTPRRSGRLCPPTPRPGYMEIAPNGRFAYIANRELGVLSIFDTTRNAVTGTIKVAEGGPQFVAFAPDGKRAYVSIFNNARTVNVVGVLDTATNAFIATIPVGVRPVRARRHAGRQEDLRAQPRLRVDHRDRHGHEQRDRHDQGGAEPALGGHLRRRQDALRGEPRVQRRLGDRHDHRQGDHDRSGRALAAQHSAPPHQAAAVQRELRQQLHDA